MLLAVAAAVAAAAAAANSKTPRQYSAASSLTNYLTAFFCFGPHPCRLRYVDHDNNGS